MSSSTVSIAILATLLFVSTTLGHSQMRCAKYNPQTGDCYAPIRNQAVSFESEAYDLTTGTTGICQSPWTNPITASYANGAGCPDYAPCPAPMGTFTPGEVFSVQWLARNHATADQTPGNISLYLSPPISQTQTSDVTHDVMSQNKFCVAPFMSCGGDNGNFVNCSSECTMPSNTAPGVYTLWWVWAWPGHTSIYATCADIFVSANGASTPSSSTTGKTLVAPTPATTGVANPSTTGTPAPATTGAKAPVSAPATTGAKAPVSAPATTGEAQSSTTGSASPNAPSSGSCVTGNMKCLSSETYSTCTFGSWASAQSCASGTQCSPSGSYIYCKAGSGTTPAPSTTASAPASAPTTPSPTPTQSTTDSSSSSCTLGYQRCTGSNTYQTCGNGRNGPTWAASQLCQSGLQCHPSLTANNVYCY